MPPCPCCGLSKKEQYCAHCIHQGVATHAEIARGLKSQADKAVARAETLLGGTTSPHVRGGHEWRKLRAAVAASEQRVALLRAQLTARKDEIKRSRDCVARSDVRERQDTLQTAQRARLSPADLRAQIAFVRAQHREVGKRIIQARRVLVREVVDVFGVQRRKGWEIAGIELPAPENFRLHPSMSINAAFMHTIHLLALLTRYLSIEVPFEPTPQAPLELVHVGRPAMKANVPFLSTSKWREKHVLWMSSTASLAGQLKKTSNSAARQAAVAGILAKSYKKHRASLTAFALLAHSVAYLAYTQGVPGIGLRDDGSRGDSEDEDENMGGGGGGAGAGGAGGQMTAASGVLLQPTAVLELISLLAESPTLGCRAHAPGTSDVLRHMGFGLDVKKVVATVLAAEDQRWGVRPGQEGKEELSEGWDLLDVET